MHSCGCGYICHCSSNPYFLAGGWGGSPFTVYSSEFLLVLSLLSIDAALYCILWFSRGCGRVLPGGGGVGLGSCPFVVYPPSCGGG